MALGRKRSMYACMFCFVFFVCLLFIAVVCFILSSAHPHLHLLNVFFFFFAFDDDVSEWGGGARSHKASAFACPQAHAASTKTKRVACAWWWWFDCMGERCRSADMFYRVFYDNSGCVDKWKEGRVMKNKKKRKT